MDKRKDEFNTMLIQNKDNIDTLSIKEDEYNSLCKAFYLKEIHCENSITNLKSCRGAFIDFGNRDLFTHSNRINMVQSEQFFFCQES
jgi:hypothetical protein